MKEAEREREREFQQGFARLAGFANRISPRGAMRLVSRAFVAHPSCLRPKSNGRTAANANQRFTRRAPTASMFNGARRYFEGHRSDGSARAHRTQNKRRRLQFSDVVRSYVIQGSGGGGARDQASPSLYSTSSLRDTMHRAQLGGSRGNSQAFRKVSPVSPR